jgi:tetratricopeptide (TPR) repeat protein
MERTLVGKKPTFHRGRSRINSYFVMAILLLNMGGLYLIMQVQRGAVQPLFQPTPTPTRQARSYIAEAEAYFAAGKIDDPFTDQDAIDTYKLALQEDPENAEVWAEMARIMTYSAELLTTRDQRIARLQEALAAANRAKEIAPENSTVRAIRSLVLSRNSMYGEDDRARQRLQIEATDEAYVAFNLDSENALALAYYAEIQLDQFKWSEADRYSREAVERAGHLMDTHRVRAIVLETLGSYDEAIAQYEQAAAINPNLTFLYIRIGVNHRHIAQTYYRPDRYELALEYFARAATINERNGVADPLPYIAIAKTYTQMGEFFIASRNGEKALSLNPTDANSYGQLGIIYFKARNYESALPALQCAVASCTAEENLVLERLMEENPNWGVEQVAVEGMRLENIEIAYYYAMYAQSLAWLSRPRENFCPQAYPVIEALRSSDYIRDAVIASIANESETICRRLDGTQAPSN